MYLGEALRVLLRRWYVLVVGLLLLAGATGGVMALVPTQYQASGQLLLVLPAQASGVETPTNPYLNLQEGLSTTASLIASSVMTKDADRELSKAGFKAEYSAAIIPGAGPIILVTTKSSSPANALATRNEVLDRLDGQLKDLQREVEVPRAQVITALPFNVDKRAEVLPGNKIRALIAAAAAIAIFTLIATFVLDGWLRRRTPVADVDSRPERDPDGPDSRDRTLTGPIVGNGESPARSGAGTRATRKSKDRRRGQPVGARSPGRGGQG